MIRLFVGIALPEDVRASLTGLCGGVPGARWVLPENLHLTLRFIGEVRHDEADDIHDALMTVRTRRFELTLASVRHFESGGQARMLWVGVEKSPELDVLHGRIESALVRMGRPPEGRRFKPHVTLARLKDTPVGRLSGFLAAHSLYRAGPMAIDHFTLFSSYLKASGPLYEPEAEYPLRAA